MNALEEALNLLYKSVERLEKNVSKACDLNKDLIVYSQVKQKDNLAFQKQKQLVLEELYDLRKILQKELSLDITKNISKKRSKAPVISMSDEGSYES